MKLLLSHYRSWVVYAGCSLAALALFTSNLRGNQIVDKIETTILSVMTPFYNSTNWVSDRIVGVWNNYFYLIDVKENNQELKSELLQHWVKIIELEEKISAIQSHQTLLKTPFDHKRKRVLANIVRRGKHSWNSTLIADAGKLDGIERFLGVSSAKGVIGQVVTTAPRTSKIITLLHPQSGIAALLKRSRISGIITGAGDGTCNLKFANLFDRVVLGEMVLTSGLEGAFPKGLPIGRVSRIEKIPGQIFQKIKIIPFANISTIEEIVIFLPEKLDVTDD